MAKKKLTKTQQIRKAQAILEKNHKLAYAVSKLNGTDMIIFFDKLQEDYKNDGSLVRIPECLKWTSFKFLYEKTGIDFERLT